MASDKKKHLKATGGYDNLKTNDKSFKAQQRLRTIEGWKKADKKESIDRGVSVFKVIILILLSISVISILRGHTVISFRSFLEFLQTCPSVEFEDFLGIDLDTIPNFILFEILGKLWNALLFIAGCLWNAVLLILWFLRYLFL